jgi:hypothetical protein
MYVEAVHSSSAGRDSTSERHSLEQESMQWDSLRPRPTRALGAGEKPLMTADPR